MPSSRAMRVHHCSHHVDITLTEVGTFVMKNSDPGTRARDGDVVPLLASRSWARVLRGDRNQVPASPCLSDPMITVSRVLVGVLEKLRNVMLLKPMMMDFIRVAWVMWRGLGSLSIHRRIEFLILSQEFDIGHHNRSSAPGRHKTDTVSSHIHTSAPTPPSLFYD